MERNNNLRQAIIDHITSYAPLGSATYNLPTDELYIALSTDGLNFQESEINSEIDRMKSEGHIEQNGNFTFYYPDPTHPRSDGDGFTK